MRIDGILLPDVPVMASAAADDFVLVVQKNGLKLQSYQNLTSTYYAVSGALKVPGVSLPWVQIAESQPTDELVLIVENNALAVKQVGFAAPTMAAGASIDVDGIGVPSVRFSGTIDGDEYVLAVRENRLCLIPIPSSFSAGALPTAGQTFYASLKTSLVPDVGTGGPTWSRATKAWGFNELGYLEELASGCAFFGGARLVHNTVRTTSEDFSNASWVKSDCTVTGTNTIVCANATSAQRVSQETSGSSAPAVTVGDEYIFSARIRRVAGGASFIQMTALSTGFGSGQYANFSLIDGSVSAVGCTATSTLVGASTDTYDLSIRCIASASGSYDVFNIVFANSMVSTRIPGFIGDGVKSFQVLRAWSVAVTKYNASYVPEYVSVGVVATPFFGAGIDGAKYFETDWQGAPIPAANLLGFRRESSATNNLLHCRDLTQGGAVVSSRIWGSVGVGSDLFSNYSFDTGLTGWNIITGAGDTTTSAGGQITIVWSGSVYSGLYQAGILTIGKTYTATVDVASGTGSIRIESGALNFYNVTFGGINTVTFVATDTSCGIGRSGAANLVINSISIKEAAVQVKKTATGLDGIVNTATTLTAAAADAIILQPITLASAARCASAYVKRRTGTGTISFTQDGGSTWTDITSLINSSTWSRVQITSTLPNPSVGFKISASGDAIDVDVVQNEAGIVATSPIVTTTATVTRNAESLTYQTESNWSDTAGTAYVQTTPVVYSGGAVGSATNGLLLSTSNSGATAYDGTNAATGPTGTPGATEKLAVAWGSSAMSVASSGAVGTAGTYDGAMGLSSIGIGVGAVGYFGDVAIYNYKMTDAELQAITT